MLHALRNHQSVDAIGSEVLHVAIEKTRALAVKHSVAIANDGAYRSAFRPACACRLPSEAAGDRDACHRSRGAPEVDSEQGTGSRQFRFDRDVPSTRRPSASWLRSFCLPPESSTPAHSAPHLRGWGKERSSRRLPATRVCGKCPAVDFANSGKTRHCAEWCCGRAKPT